MTEQMNTSISTGKLPFQNTYETKYFKTHTLFKYLKEYTVSTIYTLRVYGLIILLCEV